MSEINSENSDEISEVIIDKEKPKYNGYYCDRCNYKTKKLKSFIGHITRKVPCDVVKNYDYGIIKANEKYEKRSEEVLSMLDQLESGQEVNIKKLEKYVDEVSRLGRVYSNFNQEDITQIKTIINKFKDKSNNIKE